MGVFGHVTWFILTLLSGGILAPVWLLVGICYGTQRKERIERKIEKQNELLKELVFYAKSAHENVDKA